MVNTLLVIGLVLVLTVLILIFRTQILMNVLKGNYLKRVDSMNKVNAIMFPIFMVVFFVGMFWYNEIAKKNYLPQAASEHGAVTDFYFWLSMGVILFAFVITNILLFTFPYTYQFSESRKAYFYPDNHKLELIWTIIPAIVLTLLVGTGLKTWNEITSQAPADATVIEVMGKQFAWQVRYPGKDGKLGKYNFRRIDAINEFGMLVEDQTGNDDFIPRELHVPKGKPVLLKIRARDVIHSVFMPHFRLKMDAVPGMQTHFWFTPTISTSEMREKTGNPDFNYELACTEVCGRGHFAMRFLVVVDEPQDYVKWAASQESFKSKNEDYYTESLKKYSNTEKNTASIKEANGTTHSSL